MTPVNVVTIAGTLVPLSRIQISVSGQVYLDLVLVLTHLASGAIKNSDVELGQALLPLIRDEEIEHDD